MRRDRSAAADGFGLSSYPRCADGNGTLSFLFFSDDDLEIARAKAICGACGLQQDCLSEAIERQEPYGVWGGQLVLDGVPVAFKRRRGRPPKTPKPILVVDQVPLPPPRRLTFAVVVGGDRTLSRCARCGGGAGQRSTQCGAQP